MVKILNIICSDILVILNDLFYELCLLGFLNRDFGYVEFLDFLKIEFFDNSVEFDKSKNVLNIKFI